MTSIKFYLREDGEDFPISNLSGQEAPAIEECVTKLFPEKYGASYWFEVDMSPEDDFVPYGVVKCKTYNKDPKNLLYANIPHPIPRTILQRVSGKAFRIYPIQYGVNPWGKVVEVIFETLETS